MSAEYPHRPIYCVDWDDTCVHEFDENGKAYWPGMGDWIEGAVEGLRWLSSQGKTVIYSLRCHLYELDQVTPRPEGAAEHQVGMIRRRLDAAGLHDIEVYPSGRGKPPARFYIDNAGLRFRNWNQVQAEVGIRERWEIELNGKRA